MLIDSLNRNSVNSPINSVFEPFWFNSQEYADKQPGVDGYAFVQEDGIKQLYIRLYKKGDELVSPMRAPFGGLEFSLETNVQVLFEFIKEVVENARLEGFKKISIVAAPECYELTKSDLLDETLIHAGFSVSLTELNYHLNTDMGAFETFIHDSEKRRLNKCLKEEFKCTVEDNPDYKLIHKLISDCRLRKGYPLSMNNDDFEKMFRDFPQRYLLFVVKDKDKTIAASIGVKVRSDILYSFLPADHIDYLAYSPMVMLNKGMYDYCCNSGYQVYDLGIATSGGLRNEGLIRFKEHLGGKLSHKYSYEINLH